MRFEPRNDKEIFYDSLKISKFYKDLHGKPVKRDWEAVVFPIQNPFNFRRPLQSLLLTLYTPENLQVTQI